MKRKILFIDRDGTLIHEPPDKQIDSLEKLSFVPGVFNALYRIAKTQEYELVMVSNQDGLGTASFPEENFLPVQQKVLEAFKNEGVIFSAVHIDPSLPEQNSPNRKPGTGMLTAYLASGFDQESSYVIGDRLTDVQLAKNLGCRALVIASDSTPETFSDLENTLALRTNRWSDLADLLTKKERRASVTRMTSETEIEVEVNLDGNGQSDISTGLKFFDHMLEQLAKHGNLDLKIVARGDLHIDEHHTIEDTALTLGEAMLKALGDKKGIGRYGFTLPMDDCLAQVALDFGGRPWLVWETSFTREKIGDVPTEMFMHFFKSFSDASRKNLNIKAEGNNEHHKIESIFKALARSIKMAVKQEGNQLPTTKGVL